MVTERWYTLYTKPNAEYQVASALRQRDIHIYLPEMAVSNPQQGRKKKPFFPCYLFIKVDFEAIGLSVVQWTPGLRRIVAFGDQPLPLPDNLIQLIQRQLGEIELAGDLPAHSFEPGDTVTITDGPFQNMLAIFEGPSSSSQRVRVLLSILGHLNRVQVALDDLAQAPPEAKPPAQKRLRRTRGRGRPIRVGAECGQLSSILVGENSVPSA